MEPASLFRLLEETVALMSIKSESKNIHIVIKGGRTNDLTLMIDRLRIQQILINLLDNAIKFAHVRSNIELIVKVTQAKEPNFIDLTISVQDYGIGISEVDRDRLFEVFFQTKDENNKKHNKKSHGLGLHICKQIARALGGDLILDPSVKIGAKFNLSLHIEVAEVSTKEIEKYKTITFETSLLASDDQLDQNLVY